MALRREIPREQQISGLRLKRQCGKKILVTHKASGEKLLIQVVAFWDGCQVTLAFEGMGFDIQRPERFDDVD